MEEPLSAANPLARDVVYGNEFGKVSGRRQFLSILLNLSHPSMFHRSKLKLFRPLLSVFVPEQALSIPVSVTKEMEAIDQAWKEYKTGQLRENEIDARRQELRILKIVHAKGR